MRYAFPFSWGGLCPEKARISPSIKIAPTVSDRCHMYSYYIFTYLLSPKTPESS